MWFINSVPSLLTVCSIKQLDAPVNSSLSLYISLSLYFMIQEMAPQLLSPYFAQLYIYPGVHIRLTLTVSAQSPPIPCHRSNQKARQFSAQPPGFPIFTDSSDLFSFFVLFVFSTNESMKFFFFSPYSVQDIVLKFINPKSCCLE